MEPQSTDFDSLLLIFDGTSTGILPLISKASGCSSLNVHRSTAVAIHVPVFTAERNRSGESLAVAENIGCSKLWLAWQYSTPLDFRFKKK